MTFFHSFLSNIIRNKEKLWRWAFLLTVSFFVAKALNLLIGHFFLPLELQSPDGMSGLSQRSTFSQPNIGRILDRNLFDSTKKLPTQPEEVEVNEDELRPSTINAELLGTIVFENSRYSAALVRDRGKNETSYYARGDRLLNSTVILIERFRIIIQREGVREFLELQAAKSDMRTSAITRRPNSRVRSRAPRNVNLEELGPGRFRVPQSTVDGLLSDLPSLLKAARAIPNSVNGQIDGFKIVEIKPDSIFEKIGIENGDIIKRVNDDNLDGVDKAMSLFNALRSEKTISIDIERNGTRLNYTYEIR